MIDRTATKFFFLILVVLSTGAAQAKQPPAATLMREHKCYVCHADNDALAGPAFVDVAAKFRGDPNAIARLAAFVRRGEHGGGPWHMPPHPEVSADEASAIARYILSLDAQHVGSPGATPHDSVHRATGPSPRS